MKKLLISIFIISLSAGITKAGNPDRIGTSGAGELLMDPWAQSAGWNGINSAFIGGVQSMRLNVGGLSMTQGTELAFCNTQWLKGSGITLNALGFSQKLGKDAGVLGIDIMSVSFGDVPITTYTSPDGGLGTFKPQFVNLGLAYAKDFSNSIHAGVALRIISEQISNVKAFGACLDAGIQYVTGPKDNIKFGVSLRNIGTPMTFGGDGLTYLVNPNNSSYSINLTARASAFELPTQLNIGGGYDFLVGTPNTHNVYTHRFTIGANFASNSFFSDQLGVGAEYSLKNLFMLRAGYNAETPTLRGVEKRSVLTGFAGGVTLDVPFNKKADNRIAIDYAYRATTVFSGCHTFGIRLIL